MSRRLVSLTGHEMPLSKGRLCVGTDPAAEVPVTPGTGLQARHFIIDTTGEVARLHVCEGCETWLNGQPVQAADLRSGDLISAGALEVRFVDDAVARVPEGGSLGLRQPVPLPAVHRDDASGGIVMMLGALLFLVLAMWMAYLGFVKPVKQLRAEEVVTREARLLSIQPHRRWLEAHFDLPPGRPVEMPKELFASLFHVSWPCREELCGKAGWPAVVGFERAVLHGPASDLVGEPVRLPIVTLEVNGAAYRTLKQHNASLQNAAGVARLTMLPLIMLAGFIGATGCSRWSAARSARRYAAANG